MHQSSYHIIERFRNLIQKHFKDDKVKILDVGSYGVNGTYKEIFSDKNKFIYTGLDVQPGPNVDYIPKNHYDWSELKDESYDVIISGQAFEHIEFPWLTIQEMSKKLKKNGLICIVAPSRGHEHKYPVDCWRYYPDGFCALAKWAGLEVLETKTFWGSTGFSDGSDQWGDTYCILHKGDTSSTIREPEYEGTSGQRIVNKNNPLRSNKAESYYSFARGEVINAIVRNALPVKKILEIGCAGGATGKKLKEMLPVDYYVGIDISEQAAGVAKQYLDRVIVADIEKTDLRNDHGLKYGDFDLILALDVLEHLYNPWDVLAILSEYLRPGGYIVASIPNIQNVTIIKDLIKGKWRYENAGILDATHVRFFTLEEIERMFSGAELSIKKTDYILNPSLDVSSIKEAGNNFDLDNLSITNLSKEDVLRMFIYQYIVIAKKGADISYDCASRQETMEELLPVLKIQDKSNDPIVEAKMIPPALLEKKDFISGLVSIVILTYNQHKYTEQCIESIKKYTPEPHEIIFVDNSSTDGTVQWIRKLIQSSPHYRLIENKENLGFSKGCNQGIYASSGEYILLLNNDVIVTEGWLSGMLECLNSAPDVGVVGPMTNNISGIQKVHDSDYSSPDYLDEYSRRFRELNGYRRVPARRIVGFCMLFKRDLVEKIGLLDESFGSGNFEDDDYSLRATLEGYTNIIAADVFIHHYGSRSFIGNGIDYSSAMAQNKKIFHKKWNGIDAKSLLGKKLLSLKTIETADHLSQKGLIEKAAEKFLEGIKNSPNDNKVYFAFSEMLIVEKRFRDALDVLHEMPADNRDLKRLILVGYCKEGLQLYEEAEEYATRVHSLNDKYALALNLKGIIEYRKGNKSAAEDFFQKAIESDRGFGEPYTNLGVLKWSNEQSEEALILIEKGFILSPIIMDIAIIYHSAVIQLKQFERAEKIFRAAKDLYPLNRRITFLLIDILIQQDKNEFALKEIQEAMISYGIDDGIISAALEIRNRIGDKTTNSKLHKKGTVSLCTIVKNEEKNLSRCLLSVKSLIDEMIIVDTGSTDKTKDIAKIFGAKVYDFEWTDNFAEARNFSLSQASGDWLLILDADEAISSQDLYVISEIINRGKRRAYSFITRNYVHNMMSVGWTANDGKYNHEEAGSGWLPSKKVRLFPNDSRIQFENQVHELVESSLKRAGIQIKECLVPIHHYGKLTTKNVISKGEDYYFLGKIKLDKKGDDMKALFDLAVQAMELKKYDEAIELWQKFLNLKTDIPKAFLTVAYVHVGSAYLRLGKYTDALLFSEKAIELTPDLKEAAVNYAFSAFYVGDVKRVISVLENLVSNVPEYLPAEVLLSSAYCIAGNKEKGIEYLKDIKKKGINCTRHLYECAKTLFSLKKVEQAMLLIDAAVESDCLNKDILNLLSECYKQKTN